jgi:hypothetical protein
MDSDPIKPFRINNMRRNSYLLMSKQTPQKPGIFGQKTAFWVAFSRESALEQRFVHSRLEFARVGFI